MGDIKQECAHVYVCGGKQECVCVNMCEICVLRADKATVEASCADRRTGELRIPQISCTMANSKPTQVHLICN